MLIFAVGKLVETGEICREGWNKGAEQQDRSAGKGRAAGGKKKTDVRVSIQSII